METATKRLRTNSDEPNESLPSSERMDRLATNVNLTRSGQQQQQQGFASQDDDDARATQSHHYNIGTGRYQQTMEPLWQEFHRVYTSREDPFESLQLLGQGSFGTVDEVILREDVSRACYARKRFVLRPRDREKRSKEIAEEARIVRRLNHTHIVKVLATYTLKNQFGIIMSPVAETDLSRFLQHVDALGIDQSEELAECQALMSAWPVCLIRALDYTHEMLVKHRDIKPSNILIMNGNVYLADFGIAKEIVEGATTGSTATAGTFTPTYSAPELFASSTRRGRAIDVYALGCVFLEIAVASLHKTIGALESFASHRLKVSGTRNYAQNEQLVLEMLWHSWDDLAEWDGGGVVESGLLCMVFLMMDPDATQRITCRQLTALLTHPTHRFNTTGCYKCTIKKPTEDSNIPLHSIFVGDIPINPSVPEAGQLLEVPTKWEDAKREILLHHIWWERGK